MCSHSDTETSTDGECLSDFEEEIWSDMQETLRESPDEKIEILLSQQTDEKPSSKKLENSGNNKNPRLLGIRKFLDSLGIPPWYRGVSTLQKSSADHLLTAIRDDSGQNTVHRTMRCLQSIGLDPLPTKNQLRTVLPLCGGSDLTLLWFLMEWLYRDSSAGSYNLNEQLILSCIAHLDTSTTLQELDRILPPHQEPKQEKSHVKVRKLGKRLIKSKEKRTGAIMPYFEKLPQRRLVKRRGFNTGGSLKAVVNPNLLFNSLQGGECRWFNNFSSEGSEDSFHNIQKKKIANVLPNAEGGNKEHEMHKFKQFIDHLKTSFAIQMDKIERKKAQEFTQIFKNKNQSYKLLTALLQDYAEKYRNDFNAMAESYHKLITDSAFSNTASTEVDQENSGKTSEAEEAGLECRQTSEAELTSKSSKYFTVSKRTLDIKFNYHKIFLDEADYKGLTNSQQNVEKKVPDSAATEQHVTENVTNGTKNPAESEVAEAVNYGLAYYDPDDDQLMDKMLQDALDIMKKQPRFVLASIPDAYRFPLLRVWIRLRYGKVYKTDELSKYFQKTEPILKAVGELGLPVETPPGRALGTSVSVGYNCRNYLFQKSNYIRSQFYNQVDQVVLDQSRVVYFAINPFPGGDAKCYEKLFAYMPARKRESYYFRPWRAAESVRVNSQKET